MDNYVEVTRRGFFGRMGNSIKGIVAGGLFFIAAFPILFINEGCAVKDHKRLAEAKKAAIEAPADPIKATNEGSLVVVSGTATTTDAVSDPIFQLSTVALRLERRVEMYQWEEKRSTETRKKVGGGEVTETTYSYQKRWSSSLERSSNFKRPEGHENPTKMPIESADFQAPHVTLGAYTLPADLVARIRESTTLPLTAETLAAMPEAIQSTYQMHDAYLYKSADPENPAIGDLRIQFEQVVPTDVTVRSQQVGESFAPWVSSLGTDVHEIRAGLHSAEDMNAKAVAAAKTRTWLVRLGGFIAMTIGLATILGPLAVLGDVIPFIGNLIRSASFFIALLLAAALSLVTIALAWFTYRPMISIPLLIAAIALGWWVRQRNKAAPAPSPPPFPEQSPPPLS